MFGWNIIFSIFSFPMTFPWLATFLKIPWLLKIFMTAWTLVRSINFHMQKFSPFAADFELNITILLILIICSFDIPYKTPGGGGGLPLWRWCRCKAPKTPYFQCYCHPMTPYFCWLSLLSSKDPTFFGEMWALRSFSPKDPLFFCIRLPQEATFCSITSTNWLFLPFSTIFFFKFLLLKHSLKDQK